MFRERLQVWSRLIDRNIGSSMRVLDAGCGPGTISLLAAVKARDVVAVDASPSMLAAARENAQAAGCSNLQFVQSDVGDPGLADHGPFDAILCSSVLEYLENPGAVLTGFAQILRENGVLMLSMPNLRSVYRLAERLLFVLAGRPRYLRVVANRWTQRQLADALTSAGFRIVETVHYGKVPAVSRVFGWLGAPQFADTLYAIVAVKTDDAPISGARAP